MTLLTSLYNNIGDHRHRPKERPPKAGAFNDVEGDVETEIEGVFGSDFEGEAEVIEAPSTTEDDIEEAEVVVSLPSASGKRARTQRAADSLPTTLLAGQKHSRDSLGERDEASKKTAHDTGMSWNDNVLLLAWM